MKEFLEPVDRKSKDFTWISQYDVPHFDQNICGILSFLSRIKCLNRADRLFWASQCLFGQPYLLGAVGEGPEASFDQNPLYRTDAFDCVTFVNTVLALALSDNLQMFKKHWVSLNYAADRIAYENRFHFISVDWNTTHTMSGLLREVTTSIRNRRQQLIYKLSQTWVNKPAWFLKKRAQDLKSLLPLSEVEIDNRLKALRDCSLYQTGSINCVPYLPLASLFEKSEENLLSVLDQCPSMAIVELICPNWDLREGIGTHLDISHMGFIFKHNHRWFFRHASSTAGCVTDSPLIDYLRTAWSKKTAVQGIHVFNVN